MSPRATGAIVLYRYIVVDHPNGPTLTTSHDDARDWIRAGHRVLRILTTREVTLTSIAIEEAEEQDR